MDDLSVNQTYCYLIFNLGSKKNVLEAVEIYQKAFNAKISSIDENYGGDGWIGVNITLYNFGIFIQSNIDEQSGSCCIHFSSEADLCKAAEMLKPDAKQYIINKDWGWTPLSALIQDKFGVSWLFCV